MANEWVDRKDVIVCEKLTDGLSCGEGKSCQQGACVDLPGYCASNDVMRNSEYGECEYDTICSENGGKRHRFQKCIDHQWVDMEEDVVCSRLTQGTSCGEGKSCESGECLDIPGHCEENGETRNSEFGLCDYAKITIVGNFAELTYLSLRDNKINDVSPLAKNRGLTKLYLQNNIIDDISMLVELDELIEFQAYNNKIRDISSLSGWQKLTTLWLADNQISDVNPLSGLENLAYLSISRNVVGDIEPISNLNQLTDLYLNDNIVTDISAVAELANLKSLSLSKNSISDIAALGSLTGLTWLSLTENKIEDLSALSEHKKLERLFLSNNKVDDIAALSNISSLKYLDLAANQVSDLGPLVDNSGIGTGDTVSVTNNPIECGAHEFEIQTLRERVKTLKIDCPRYQFDGCFHG